MRNWKKGAHYQVPDMTAETCYYYNYVIDL